MGITTLLAATLLIGLAVLIVGHVRDNRTVKIVGWTIFAIAILLILLLVFVLIPSM